MALGFRALGFRALGFGALGFRALGFRTLGFRALGFRATCDERTKFYFPMLWDSEGGWVLCPSCECNSSLKLLEPGAAEP